MQTNDVQVTRVYTTNKPGAAQDNTPNELGGTRLNEFQLVVNAESGDNLGDLQAAYTLIISATSTSGGTTTFARRKLAETITAGKFGWTDLGNNAGYAKQENIMVRAADFPAGDAYRFTVTLLANNGVVSTESSNEFVTI
ncbi:hypothetical protein ACGFNU_00300 [Spirillospora sp. NPDC048911]|uniref:hypothetical protein n=1 Tax=Spirillospora sp. NPDC048911 TaxID=3364527 RepID=UPI0037212044